MRKIQKNSPSSIINTTVLNAVVTPPSRWVFVTSQFLEARDQPEAVFLRSLPLDGEMKDPGNEFDRLHY